jgi:hypothetical protein
MEIFGNKVITMHRLFTIGANSLLYVIFGFITQIGILTQDFYNQKTI